MKSTAAKFLLPIGFLWFFFVLFSIISCNKVKTEDSNKSVEISNALQQKPNTHQLDSLYKEALTNLTDSTRIDIILKIYKKTIHSRLIRYDILDTALALSKRINYNKGIAISYDRKGINNRYEIRYLESVNYHKKALHYWDKTTDTLGRIKSLNSIGVSLRRLNNETEAMNYYLEALKLSKAINHFRSIAVALNGIGNVFVNIKQYSNALPYFKEALVIEVKLNNKKGISYDLSNIGEVFVFQQQYDSALWYYEHALKIAEERNYKDSPSIIYNCIGYLFQQKGDYKLSNKYYALAIPKLEQYNGKRYLSNTLINLGMNYTQLDKYELATANITHGLTLAQEINSPENIILGYQALSKYYEKTGVFNLALDNYKKTISIRDSVSSDESKQNIATLEAIYENELKDKEIRNYQYQVSLQKNQNILQWTIITFLILLVLASFVYYRLRQKHNKLVVVQMRNDIQEYVHKIERYEHNPDKEDEKLIFQKNVSQYGLSEREIDVLLLISKGLKNDEIAEKLFVSLSTIKTHTRNIFIKLDVRNRIEATRKTQVV